MTAISASKKIFKKVILSKNDIVCLAHILRYIQTATKKIQHSSNAMPLKSDKSETIAHRLTEMIRRLCEGEALSPKALVALFAVDARTIQRDLNVRLAFLDLDKTGGAYTMNPMRLGILKRLDIERFADLAGLQGLHPRFSTDFLRDMLDSRLQSALQVRGYNYEELHGKEQLFNQLKDAISQHHPIGFEYTKPDGAKMVEGAQPYRLVNQDGIWYVAAVDGGKLKTYAFSKIDRLLVSPDTFTPEPVITQIVNEEDSIWMNLNKTEVILKVAPAAADYFKRRKLIGGQKTVKELEDGGLIVSALIAHPNQILPIVRYWLPNIHVISPEGLQTELEKQLRNYLRLA